MAELLPCPFCGEEPSQGPWKNAVSIHTPDAWAIECSSEPHKCPIQPSIADFEKRHAIAAWNTRAAPASHSREGE